MDVAIGCGLHGAAHARIRDRAAVAQEPRRAGRRTSGGFAEGTGCRAGHSSPGGAAAIQPAQRPDDVWRLAPHDPRAGQHVARPALAHRCAARTGPHSAPRLPNAVPGPSGQNPPLVPPPDLAGQPPPHRRSRTRLRRPGPRRRHPLQRLRRRTADHRHFVPLPSGAGCRRPADGPPLHVGNPRPRHSRRDAKSPGPHAYRSLSGIAGRTGRRRAVGLPESRLRRGTGGEWGG